MKNVICRHDSVAESAASQIVVFHQLALENNCIYCTVAVPGQFYDSTCLETDIKV